MDNSMIQVRPRTRPRNWVAKNNRNRPARHRAATDYQRQPKHRNQEAV
jgi:hypothetical protein